MAGLSEQVMRGFAEITEKDVIEIMGPDYVIDQLWKREFGREVEYRYRAIPKQLVYLLFKYGPVIPHGDFVESISEVCAVIKWKPNSNELETQNLSKEKSEAYIETAVRLGLITVVRPGPDRRYRLYRITQEQLEKLRRVEKGAAEVYKLIAKQAENPRDFTAGMNDANRNFYKHVVKDMVLRHDDAYHTQKSRLERLRYLLSSIVVFVIYATAMLLPVLAEAATLSGGSK